MPDELRRGRKYRMYLLNLVFPNVCPCCDSPISWEKYLCDACIAAITGLAETFCPVCGKPPESCLCGTGLAYDRTLVVTAYEKTARQGIFSLKDAKSLQFGWYCGEVLGKRILADARLRTCDCIVPVPMARWKKWRRCCNPAEVIAKELAAVTGIPMRKDLLLDSGRGSVQHMLTAEQRQKNTSQFSVWRKDLTGYRILLCDDVLTTGSTLNRCAALLKSCGAETVTAVVATSTRFQNASDMTTENAIAKG
ncbi:MAG: ComF family protein [Ruminococcus sp.]